jgi:hypothetical protein
MTGARVAVRIVAHSLLPLAVGVLVTSCSPVFGSSTGPKTANSISRESPAIEPLERSAPAAVPGPSSSPLPSVTFTSVVSQCNSAAGGPGGAVVTISVPVVGTPGSYSINEPCALHITGHGSIYLTDVQLTSSALLISDDASASATFVDIAASTLQGSTGGLQITLTQQADTISITSSTLAFADGVWLWAGQLNPSSSQSDGGAIHIANSSLQSAGATSQGIRVLAGPSTGVVTVTSVTFDTTFANPVSGGSGVLLMAGVCEELEAPAGSPQCNSLAKPSGVP